MAKSQAKKSSYVKVHSDYVEHVQVVVRGIFGYIKTVLYNNDGQLITEYKTPYEL